MSTQIKFDHVFLDIPIFDKLSRSARAKLEFRTSPQIDKTRILRALNDITITINNGDRVGLLGHNGAGKSTLLKTISGVYEPSKGQVEIDGQISSLFNVAVGVDNTANGYDNIPLLMAARSIPLNQLPEITKDIEEFTELGEALYRPLRTYSAGMRLRLAFAVATASTNQILLLDEIVGVGDKNFRKKSQLRIKKLMQSAGILVVASHSNDFLKMHCTRGLVFEKGALIYDGQIEDAIKFQTEKQS